jgi:hypothetical protein
MPSVPYARIRSAIADKKQVVATYRGHRREMCPHAIGLGPAGNEQALFYQFAGGSSKGDVAKLDERDRWRCMALDALEDVEIRNGEWQSAGNHSVPNTCIKEIDLEVEY